MNVTTTIAGRRLAADRVLATCVQLDRHGANAFLDRHGYGRARTWLLRVNGRSYPSKAIVGVAAGLKASEFFGGVQGAVRALQSLGFSVRHAETGELADKKLDCLRRLLLNTGLDVLETAWPSFVGAYPTAYFASGSNQPDQISAMGKAGIDVGVAVPNLSANGEAELLKLKGSDVQVFVDSGAFSEVKFHKDGTREVVKPMTEEKWETVLSTYERLSSLGQQLWVVAPDCVGDQQVSIDRVKRYASRVLALADLGVRVLVPVQKGELSQAEFAWVIDAVLGRDKWTPSMPCMKAATTPAELGAFVDEFCPRHVHLLGIGVRNRKLPRYLQELAGTSVSLDSCWIAANAVRSEKKPRRLIRAADAAKKLLGRVRAAVSSVELSVYSCFAR